MKKVTFQRGMCPGGTVIFLMSYSNCTPTPVYDLRKGGYVVLKGHPCKIVDMTTTKMRASSSGRAVHPDISCDGCESRILDDQIRYACLDCQDFDFCEQCEEDTLKRTSHADGKHVFAKIRDSRNVTVKRYRDH
jgi:hypothetical protein